MIGLVAAVAWRATNYLCVSQLYLRRNVLLDRPLVLDDLKPRIVGHWGTAPGCNFILTHLSVTARATHVPILPVLGTGHAASSILAWLYLEGTLGEIYPELTWSRAGLERLVAGFGSAGLFRSELSAFIPGIVASTGELGPAHGIAQGISLDLESPRVACIVGDGELETGPGSASLLAQRELADHAGHAPLLIVNLNGWRMGARSILGRMSRAEIEQYFRAFGYIATLVEIPDHDAAHQALCDAVERPLVPHVVVVLSEKGVTFPQLDGRYAGVVGSERSHKAPLSAPAEDPEAFDVLARWLYSYEPSELFTADGAPSERVQAALPPPPLRLGRQWTTLPTPTPLTLHANKRPLEAVSRQPMAGVDAFLADILDTAHNRERLRIFSPDELNSNGLAGLSRRFPERVLEMLNEELCHAWAEGYVRSGRHSLLVSYEAFASRFATAFAQFLKFSTESKQASFRPEVPSLTYLLTSLGWHNVFSHQNPDFVSVMLLRRTELERVYFPVNAERLLARLKEALASTGRINAVVASKHTVGPELDEAATQSLANQGAAIIRDCYSSPDLILAGAGDVACASVVKAADLLARSRPGIRLRTVFVEEVARLSHGLPGALSADTYRRLFGEREPVLFAFIGYPATIQALVGGRCNAKRFAIVGYEDRTGHDFESTLRANGMAPEQLAQRALEMIDGARRHDEYRC